MSGAEHPFGSPLRICALPDQLHRPPQRVLRSSSHEVGARFLRNGLRFFSRSFWIHNRTNQHTTIGCRGFASTSAGYTPRKGELWLMPFPHSELRAQPEIAIWRLSN